MTAGGLRFLLLLDDDLSAAPIRAALPATALVKVASLQDAVNDSADLVEQARPDIALVGCSARSHAALGVIGELSRERGCPTVVLYDGTPNGFMEAAFGMGADDLIVLPQPEAALAFALEKAIARWSGGSSADQQAPLITVLGPKGGTGKTLTACNLAVALADTGARPVVVDLDLQFGDVGLALGLKPERTLYDLAVSGGTLDAGKVASFVLDHPSGARALLAPTRPDHAAAVSIGLIRDVLEILRARYDYVIVDTPPAFSPEVIAAIDASTHLCIVGMLDALSLKDTKIGLETLQQMGYEPEETVLVLNRADSSVGISQADVVSLLGKTPDVLIPSDRAVPRALTSGRVIVQAEPKSGAARAFKALAALYVDEVERDRAVEGREDKAERRPARLALARRGELTMELHERIGGDRRDSGPARTRDPFAALKNRIHLALVSELGPQLFDADDTDEPRDRVASDVRQRLEEEQQLSREDRERLVKEISDDIFGYGPLEPLLMDSTISEIMVNGADEIWIEREGVLIHTDIRFSDEAQLRRIITKMVGQIGRRIDESSPMVDARLPDGSRVNAIIAPLSLSGPLLTIRRFAVERFDLEELVHVGAVSEQAVSFLRQCVEARMSVLVSGGTGTGKTTLLNALSAAIPERERIVTIEDAAELQLKQRHTIRLESRPNNIEGEGEVTIRDLVRNALRMRPDRIIVGEVRGPEALDMLQAMNTGHEGSLSTIHANSPRDALNRLETMVLMAGFELPLRAIRHHISSALDVIVQLERLDDGSRHVTAISEVQRMEGEMITLQHLFEFEHDGIGEDGRVSGRLRSSGLRPSFLAKFRRRGMDLDTDVFGPAEMLGANGSDQNGGYR